MAVHFEIWDYLTMSLFIILSSVPGLYQVYAARKTKSTTEFLVVNNHLGVVTLILSTIASNLSAITMLCFPVDIYMYGLSFSFVSLGFALAAPIGAYLILPVLYLNKTTNVFEYLELRFCKSLRIIVSGHTFISMLFHTAFTMYSPALALAQVTGLHVWTSVLTIGITAIVYTALGGFRAVVWSDVTQCFLMIGVFFIIIFRGIYLMGGLDIVWEKVKDGNRSNLIEWRIDAAYPIWTTLIGFSTIVLSNSSLGQIFIQRYLSNKTLKKAKTTYLGSSIIMTLVLFVLIFVGLIMYAYNHNCDPLLSGQTSRRDQLVALMALEMLSFCKGLPGIFVAGVMCASLSSVTSMLNSMVVVTLSDYVPNLTQNMSERNKIKLSSAFTLFYGMLCIALVSLIENVEDLYIAANGTIAIFGGPKLTVFLLGMLFPFINSKGAIAGFFGSMILPLWAWIYNLMNPSISLHKPLDISGCPNSTNATIVYFKDPVADKMNSFNFFYSVSSFWYISWSFASGLVIALIVSHFTESQASNEVNPALLIPFSRRFLSLNKKNTVEEEKQSKCFLKATDEPCH